MSVLVVGMSHRSAPVTVLEKVSMDDSVRDQTTSALLEKPSVSEALIVSTCNRVEVYVVTNSFHTGVNEVVEVLHDESGIDIQTLRDHLYVRYADAAAEHMLVVTSGLDSMVVGEQQIIGQVRTAYQRASDVGSVGPALHALTQVALQTGKRVHSETEIDDAGASMVSFAAAHAMDLMGINAEAAQETDAEVGPLAGKSALVLGAGAMASLAASHFGKLGVDKFIFSNRTRSRAEILAERSRELGIAADTVEFEHRASVLDEVDIVISATGADTFTIEPEDIPPGDHPLMLIDLSMPRDIDDAVAEIDAVQLVNIERLNEMRTGGSGDQHAQAMKIVNEQLEAYTSAQRVRDVVPTVAALRQQAAALIDAELERLIPRTPTMDDADREEVSRTVKRVVDKLLHKPTVRVKELAASAQTVTYETALKDLFDLDLSTRSVDVSANKLPGGAFPTKADRVRDTEITAQTYKAGE